MAKPSIQWIKTPEKLQERVGDFGRLVNSRVGEVLVEESLNAQAKMKLTRPWSDITGNARRGLRVVPQESGEGHVMFFIHTVEYGKYLELARGGAYKVVWPTLLNMIPILRRRLKGLV